MPIRQNIINNPKSERVRRVADLSNRRSRERSGRFLVEGPQSVREAVRYMPQVITDVYVTVSDDPERSSRDPELARHGYEGSPETMPDDVPVSALLSPIVAEAAKAGLYVHLCMPGVIERMSRDAQGIVAVGDAEAMRAAMCDAFDDAACGIFAGDAPTLVAAFWQVRDPGNAGTVIRAADAAGCMGVVFVDDCVEELNPKVIRSTAGSLFHLPVVTMTTDGFFAWCDGRGLPVTAADVYGTPANRPRPLPEVLSDDEVSRAPRAVLFGNEARGLPADILERAAQVVSIPLYGRAESLNLGTSAAVMLMSMAMSSHVRSCPEE